MSSSNSPALAQRFYRSTYRIRRVEEEISRVYPTDRVKSPVHLSIGQEAVAVGVCEALRPSNVVFATYRGHAAYLAKGGDLKRMVAELYGKAAGFARGKAGSMHLIDVGVGMMGTSAIVATTIPQAVGYAFAMRYLRKDVVTAAFFGDGAVDEGAWHESMNFAALKQLPLIFICENNFYAIHSHVKDRMRTVNILERARSYGMPVGLIEDGDSLRLYDEVSRAASDICTRGKGPCFFEVTTYRYARHVGPGDDTYLNYRTREELDAWKAKDELARLERMIDPATAQKIRDEVEAEIAEAFTFAEESAFPAAHELYEHVFHA